MTWTDGKLSDLAFFQRGFDITKKEQRPGPYPVVSSSGVKSFHAKFKVEGPGVVIGRKGTLGTVHYIDSDFWPHDTSLWVKDFKGNLPRFVYYFVRTMDFGRFDVGGANPTLNRNHIHGLPIRIPPLEIQERIGGVLAAYDDLIENNNRRMALLEEAIHLLYREWFVYLRFPGHDRIEVVDGVPEGWSRGTASDVIDFDPRTPVSKDQERPFVPMGSLSTASMRLVDVGLRVPKGGAKFKNDDTLLARITPCLENGKTGFVQFMETDEETATGSTEFIVLRGAQVPSTWVYGLARSPQFRQHAINSMTGSDGRQRVGRDSLKSYKLAVPPAKLLREWDEVARPVFAQIKLLNDQNAVLREAGDLLLRRLMNGSIAV
jgi:type I restriction enzyme S subunit